MLQITIPAGKTEEYWDETKEEFVYNTVGKEQTLSLEHSLVSLRKWESKWHKPFFDRKEKTRDEELDYIKCMTLTKNVPQEVYDCLTKENMDQIRKYIEDPMTATTFHEEGTKGGSREIVTAEVIYYWMVQHRIPVEFEKWHLNQLLTLIRVCNVKNAPPKKQNKAEMMRNRAALNAARRKKYNTKG